MFQNYQIAYLRQHVKVKKVIPLSFLRESVAYVLSQSARRIPHAAAIAHFDVTPLIEYTKSGRGIDPSDETVSDKSMLLQRAIRRNYTAFFLKVIAQSLSCVPQLNGFLDYAPWRLGGRLYLAEDINLSFTVHTKHGVIRPIIRNAHKKDLETVANEVRALTRRARRTDPEELFHRVARAYMWTAFKQLDVGGIPGFWVWLRSKLHKPKPDPALINIPEEDRLQVEDVLGATCTVASIGMMMSGHQTVTVIVPPEVMMFGIGDIRETPWVVDGEVVVRHVVTVAGTMDHRAFDGGEVFPFYEHVKNFIDHPELIYEWKPGD
jgi:pyruvate dehydrogenase E2 component (dihydrolipoamide acetyltransferase)